MFEDLIRELKPLEEPTQVPIEMSLDEDRYFDRACTNPECGVAFKVQFDDWRDKVPDDEAHCPVCKETKVSDLQGNKGGNKGVRPTQLVETKVSDLHN